MMFHIRRWFLAHWFGGGFAILGLLWIVTEVAYAAGVDHISVGNKFTGQDATIDFMRKYDHPVVELADQVGLQLESRDPVHGAVVKLEPAPPVLCWVCGSTDLAGGIAIVDYRQGDWFFRAPDDNSTNDQARNGRPESRDYILTIAYNRATGERVIAPVDADLAAQQRLLTARGLAPGDALRLGPATLVGLAPVSMMREGCVIFHVAFVATMLLWLVLGGSAALIVGLVRRRRVRPSARSS